MNKEKTPTTSGDEELVEQLFQYYDDIDCAETVNQRINAQEQAELWLKRLLTTKNQQITAAKAEERRNFLAKIEEADFARKVAERTGNATAVYEVQDVIEKIKTLTNQ